MLKVIVKGVGKVTLSKSDFVASGGEGSIYAKQGRAYKIYTDRNRMMPVAKITELAAIDDEDVIKPEHVLTDAQDHPIGYDMRFVQNTLALSRLFPPGFRTKNGIDPDRMLKLIQALQARVESVHKAGCLVVDLSELNFLVDNGFANIYAIDVDSYQTANFPATAITPGSQDYSVQGRDFTELSDWFSFAVIAFNMFIGVHPYRGKYKGSNAAYRTKDKNDPFKPTRLRMTDHVSVFNPDVRVPKVALPLTVIPPVWLEWFKAVLENGKRLPPPAGLHAAITLAPTVRVLTGTRITIVELFKFPGNIRGVVESYGTVVAWSEDGTYVGGRKVHGEIRGVAGVGFTQAQNRPVIAGTSGGKVKLFDPVAGVEIDTTMHAEDLMVTAGRIYARCGDKILEAALHDMGNIVVTSTLIASCLPQATRLFPGCAIQNMLGSMYVSLFPFKGVHHQIRLQELESHQVIEAKYDGQVLVVIVADNQGLYHRLVFRFSQDFSDYDMRRVENIPMSEPNFIVLDNGVVILLNEDEELELFSNRMGSAKVNKIQDPVLGADMQLVKIGGKAAFYRGTTAYSMTMK